MLGCSFCHSIVGVVVNVQATAFVFAVSDLCHFMKGVVVNVQATAVVLQFLSVPEGAGVQEPGASPAGGCAWNLPPRAQLPEAAPALFRHHG